MHSEGPRRGRLRAAELAEAVVLADLTLVLSIVSAVLPFGGPLLVIAVVPMAALAARNRLRAVIVGTVAASTVGFLVLGPPAVTSVAGCGAIGAVVGYAARRRYGPTRTAGVAVVFLWPLVSAIVNLLLWVFPANRKLALAQVRNGWSGAARVVRWLGDRFEHVAVLRNLHLRSVADHGDRFIAHAIADWWVTIPVVLLFIVVLMTVLAQRITAPTLSRVRAAFATDEHLVDDDRAIGAPVDAVQPAPVPVSLRHVGYRYPGAAADSLHDVTLDIATNELVAIVGPNGSGKSTLARLLAGRTPTAGEVVRPGAIGLGAPGGTAIVFQRPELQVLGVRVRDDIGWGLTRGEVPDVDALLDRVGLQGFADRETSTLSGGELQRLALAAALARRPRLLISDESTAMVDEEGRAQLVGLLRSLVRREGMAVVHVTHQQSESAVADRVLALESGRVVPAPDAVAGDAPAPRAVSAPAGEPLLVLRDAGHVYSPRSPWAHRALVGVNLRIHRGEAVLVVGHNGSGKSTLAWILAGLLDPGEGEAQIDGVRISSVVGKIGVAFQHARLQLLRPTVAAEVGAASGASPAAVWRALSDIGFDPSAIATRRVDELSGGEARRVVLASALAASRAPLVLDEPFAGLDERAREDLTTALTRLRVERGMTLVCVSHDRDLPPELVDREVELTAGRITYDGPPRRADLGAAQEKRS